MKRKITKGLLIALVLVVATFAALEISGATNYTKTWTGVSGPIGYGSDWTRFSGTFVARTDTFSCGPFTLPIRNVGFDTSYAMVNVYLGKNSDSINVKVMYQYASAPFLTSGVASYKQTGPQVYGWSPLQEIAVHSTVGTRLGDTLIPYTLSRKNGGPQPYMRFLVIGNTALAGGKANEVSNTFKVDVIPFPK